jgi:hypothetical protein
MADYRPMTMSCTGSDPTPAAKPGTGATARALPEVLDVLTHQAHRELDTVSETLFFMGDGLQRAAVDVFFNLFRQQTWTPGNVFRVSCDTVNRSLQLARLLLPDQAHLAWQELRNKLDVFILVKNLSSVLGLPSDRFLPLPELVAKAYAVSHFSSLWAVEGLGHYYADIYWERRGVPQGLLSEEQAPVPAKSLLMLHAGIGLSFADRLLGTLTSQASPDQVRGVLEYFLILCRSNSRKGYLGAAVESLGLVTRDFYPDLLPLVEQQLRQVGPEFTGYFWHGVGRALYFSREHFLPVLQTVWSSVDTEAINAPDRLNAMAGLSWAITLVNMCQPAIMENSVRLYLEHSDLADGFTNGVISAIIMRTDTTPDAPFTPAFYQHRTNPYDRELAVCWERLIRRPSEIALDTYYPVLRQHGALDEIFHYQDQESLVSQLRGRTTSAVSEGLV